MQALLPHSSLANTIYYHSLRHEHNDSTPPPVSLFTQPCSHIMHMQRADYHIAGNFGKVSNLMFGEFGIDHQIKAYQLNLMHERL